MLGVDSCDQAACIENESALFEELPIDGACRAVLADNVDVADCQGDCHQGYWDVAILLSTEDCGCEAPYENDKDPGEEESGLQIAAGHRLLVQTVLENWEHILRVHEDAGAPFVAILEVFSDERAEGE